MIGVLIVLHRCQIAAFALGVLSIACNKQRSWWPEETTIKMADPEMGRVLLCGFHEIESGLYRWTDQNFAVALSASRWAEQSGARLTVRLYIPEVQITRLGEITLYADFDGTELEPQTFSSPGTHTYSRVVRASAVRSNIVPISFTLDKVACPIAEEARRLGVVVLSIGLEPI
jgi:hypothetical protein